MRQTFLRYQNLFFWDYSLAQLLVPFAGGLAIVAYFIFHFIEKSMGYSDSWLVRTALMAVLVPLLFFPRKKAYAVWHAIYWELAVMLALPFMQTYLFLLNRPDDYWKSSLLFEGIVLGILTKAVWLPVSILAGTALGITVYEVHHDLSWDSLKIVFDTMPLVFLLGFIGQMVRVSFDVFYQQGLRLSEERLQRESAQKEIAQARAAAEVDRLLMEQLKSAIDEIKKREECIIRFVRPSIVEEIRNGKNPLECEPEMRNMAVMFCDIREFTQLTEVLNAFEKLQYLNAYFSKMTAPIVQNKGEVDKIMGDAIMGIFNDGAEAVRAAVGMRKALHDYNREMMKAGRIKIRNGIGISKGEVIWGNFGSIEKLDRTVIGEPVNIASRLESKTKMYSLEIVITEAVEQDLDGKFQSRWIDNVQVMGSSRQLKLYEIYDHQPQEVIDYKNKTKEIMEKALKVYFQKGFRDALRMFKSIKEGTPSHLYVEGEPMDSLMDYYIQRCKDWEANPDAWELMQQWEGYHVFQEK